MPQEQPQSAGATPDAGDAKKQPRKKLSLRRRLLKTAMFLLYVLILCEIGSRCYWKIKRDVPFFSGRLDWYNRFYDEMKDSGVWSADLRRDDGHFDILFLGGSALDRVCSSLAGEKRTIQHEFEKLTGLPVRTFNLANPGLTTRDSLIKYRLLGEEGKHFDLVIVYHGINDARLNNCPPENFKDDYTHGGWYRQIRRMEAQRGLLPFFTLPYTVEYTVIHILSSKKFGIFVPRHKQNPKWVRFGRDVKTAGPFGRNLQAILDLAAERGEPVLLMTFAWYVPADYTPADCKAGRLDYAPSPAPSVVELWGSQEGVTKALRAHNQAVRELAGRNGQAIFVDAAAAIPKAGANFNDVCHLSEKGKRLLMQTFMPAMHMVQKAQP